MILAAPKVPRGYCRCGCGERTPLAARDRPSRGYRKGEPLPFCPNHRSADRRVEVADNGCWLWQGSMSGNGYGLMKHRGKVEQAHRWSYERKHGPIPSGLDLDHKCQTPRCVNPDHLEPVNHFENIRRSARAKLDWDAVDQIRAATGSHAQIAAAFGVAKPTVTAIRSGRAWRDEHRAPAAT